ncbi:MAG: efflux RND transporter periplasmic adaptor subunit [Clostridiales bacterium]|nr:efflux RND transporter periplasmic adaptor subunit [Clostridiales bacterium]
MKIHRKNAKGLRPWYSILLIALVLMLFSHAALAENETADIPVLLEPVGVKMDCATAYRGELSDIEVYDASVIPYVEEIYFPIGGSVEDVHVVTGQKVKAGDALITLNHESKTKEIEALQKKIDALEANSMYADSLAKIDLDILEFELQKLQNQHTPDPQKIALKQLEIEEKISAIAFDQSLRARELSALREELALLQEETAQAVLTAPFDGQIMFCANLKKGSYISAFNPLIYMADSTRLSVQAEYISPSVLRGADQIYALIGAKRYSLTNIPLDTTEYLSKVLAGETIYTQFAFDVPDEDITAGLYAALCLESEVLTDALLIPSNALYSDSAGGRYVYVIENNERTRRNVKTGRMTDWEVQIVEGLTEGEVVYVKE